MKGFFRKNAVLGFAEIFGRLPLVFAAGYVAKTLGPEVYGNWALVLAFTGVLVMFASLGLSSSLSRLASVATPEQARGYLGMALGMSVLATLACAALVAGLHNPLAHVFGLDDDVAWLLIPGAALALVGVTESLLDGYFKSRILVARGSLFILIRSLIECFAIISVFGGFISVPGIDGVELLALYVVVNMTLKFVAYPFLVRFRAPAVERPEPDARRTFLQYGLPMIPASIVVFLTAQGDRLVLGHLLSKEALGVYAFGASLAAYMMYIGYATNPLLLPRASVMHDEGDDAGVAKLFADSQRVLVALFVCCITVIAIFSEEIVKATAGDAYLGTQTVFILLSIAVGLEAVFGVYQWIFHLARRPSYILWFNLVYLSLNLAAVIGAGLADSTTLVAVGALVVVILANGARAIIARRFIPIRMTTGAAVSLAAFVVALVPITVWVRDLPLGARIAIALPLLAAAGVGLWMGLTGRTTPTLRRRVAYADSSVAPS